VNPPSRDWERLYTAVILETDRSKLKSRIDTDRPQLTAACGEWTQTTAARRQSG
jgi:hypothetical protein